MHFNIQHGSMVLVEREEYDDDMVLVRTLYKGQDTLMLECSIGSYSDFLKFSGLERA